MLLPILAEQNRADRVAGLLIGQALVGKLAVPGRCGHTASFDRIVQGILDLALGIPISTIRYGRRGPEVVSAAHTG